MKKFYQTIIGLEKDKYLVHTFLLEENVGLRYEQRDRCGMNDETIMTTIINKFKDSYEHQLVIAKLLEDTFDEENAKAYIMDHLDDWKIISEAPFKNTGMTNKMISCNRYTFVMTNEFEETIVVLRDYETELKNIF